MITGHADDGLAVPATGGAFGHLRALGQSAVPTGVAWIAGAAGLCAPFLRMPRRVFSNAGFETARGRVLAWEVDS